MRYLLLFLFLSSCSSTGYLLESGLGQWKLFNRARPISEVLASPYTTEPVRQGIEVVKKAKAFAVSDLGLKATKNYETYVALDRPCLLWAVSASHPLELKEKLWSFPIVGAVPYLGFFSEEGAKNEARKLQENEKPTPDVWTRCVPAFSSLGWFSDPLYSSMIKGKDHQIVEVIVHESLHATVWVPGSVDFNEKLANFVGLEGSVRYMQKMEGDAGAEKVREEVRGEKVFAEFIKDSLVRYRETVKTLADKEIFYRELPAKYQAAVQAKAKSGAKLSAPPVRFEKWNNAALLAYANYYSDYSVLEAMLKKCGNDLGRFVGWIEAEKNKGDPGFKESPEAYLAKLSVSAECPVR